MKEKYKALKGTIIKHKDGRVLFASYKTNIVEVLHDALCDGINLRGADLRGVNLEKADFEGGIFTDVDFRGANLSLTFFHNAVLSGADLRGANLKHTFLSTADTYEIKITNKEKEMIIEALNWEIVTR